MAAEGLPVELSCRVLDVSVSGYFGWRSRPPSPRAIRHAWLTDVIAAVHASSRDTYGARRVHAELTMGRGIAVGHNAIELLMRRAGPGRGLTHNRSSDQAKRLSEVVAQTTAGRARDGAAGPEPTILGRRDTSRDACMGLVGPMVMAHPFGPSAVIILKAPVDRGCPGLMLDRRISETV